MEGRKGILEELPSGLEAEGLGQVRARFAGPAEEDAGRPLSGPAPATLATAKELPRRTSTDQPKAATWPDLAQLLVWLMDVAYRYLFLLNQYITHGTARHTRPRGAWSNQLLVVGDDFAAGYGDTLSLGSAPGLARYLPRLLAKEPTLRQDWGVYNCGKLGSTSRDWLPGGPLLSGLLEHPRFRDARIVLLLLGNTDARAEVGVEESVRNVERIAQALGQRGMLVWVQSCHTWPGVGTPATRGNVQRNELLTAFLARAGDSGSCNTSSSSTVPGTILPGVRVDGATNFEYRLARYFSASDEHLSAAGYLKLAKDYVDLLTGPMVRVEFARFRERLGLGEGPATPAPAS